MEMRANELITVLEENKAYKSTVGTLPSDMKAIVEKAIHTLYEGFESYTTAELSLLPRRDKVTKSVAKGGIYSYGDNSLSQLTWYVGISYDLVSRYLFKEFADHMSIYLDSLAKNFNGKFLGGSTIHFDNGLSIEYSMKANTVSYSRNNADCRVSFPIKLKVVVPNIKVVDERNMPEHNDEKHQKLIKSLEKALSSHVSDKVIGKAVALVERAYSVFPYDYVDASRITHKKDALRVGTNSYDMETFASDIFTWGVKLETTHQSASNILHDNIKVITENLPSLWVGGIGECYPIGENLYINLEIHFGSRGSEELRFNMVYISDMNPFDEYENPLASSDKLQLCNDYIYLRLDVSNNHISGSERDDDVYWTSRYHYYTKSSSKTKDAWIELLKTFDKNTTDSDVSNLLSNKFGIYLHSYLPD